jgi:hypothetical protein
MKKSRIFFFIAIMFFLAGLTACGTESNDSTGSALSTFSEEVKLCTPFLDGSGEDLGDNTLDAWDAWDPQAQKSVLGKLFNPDIGQDECIVAQIEILDSHIAKVNEFIEYWGEDGTYTIGDMTAIIDNGTSSVYVPYLRGFFADLSLISVEREITLTDSGDDLTIHMAFLNDGGVEYIVTQYAIGSTQAGVYYTERDGDSLRVWHASVKTRKVQFTWEGNTGEKWFKITQCSDATGNWEVMGGGSIVDEGIGMAFMARNDDTSSSNEEYYLTITLEELNNGTEPDDGIIALGTSTLSGSGVLAYITEGEPECFGFLGPDAYPGSVGDLAWVQ